MRDDFADNYTIPVTLVFILLFILAMLVNHDRWNTIRALRKEVTYYQTNYQYKVGTTALYDGYSLTNPLSYRLATFDGGKNWYALDTKADEVVVVGSAEEIYPKLLKHLNDMDLLFERIKHGPITNFSDPKDIELLKNVGVTVESK